ncbi:DUF483 domain-containing protein, partial [Candidatus Bathyarchaeota archaeon]|nr:DUF483 domain-containing protein [Candidatus Bathyarchaeota archaeon]
RRIYPRIVSLEKIVETREKMKVIEAIKREMSKAFREIVEASREYSALIEWAEALRLGRTIYQVRPTVQEIFLFKEKSIEKKLNGLLKEREKIRAATLRGMPQVEDKARFVYPEEFNRGWLRRMGEILSYPSCCVERYAEERERGISVEERAASQIREKAGSDLNVLAYFVAYFFPCSPNCKEAISRGESIYNELSKLDPSIGETYKRIAKENSERVRHQPEILREYKQKAIEDRRKYG